MATTPASIYVGFTSISWTVALIPKEYGVIGSDYDGVNDALYVYARLDSNKNGTIDPKEPKHIFLIDLKKPETTALLYK
mgnify:CR=1 FL=1